MAIFHERHPKVGIELNVTRRPYSFGGDRVDPDHPEPWMWGGSKGDNFVRFKKACSTFGISEQQIETFSTAAGMRTAIHVDKRIIQAFGEYKRSLGAQEPFGAASVERLLNGMEMAEKQGQCGRQDSSGKAVTALEYYLNSRMIQARGEMGSKMTELGKTTSPPIKFNIDVEFHDQPVDSQRLLQWAARVGKQEEVVSALARLHFEEQTSVNKRSTLLKAATEVGLDTDALVKFLDSDELVPEIWRSYGETINKHGIHAIPFFVFNGPFTNGGPFRDGSNTASIIRGSANAHEFLSVFEQILGQGLDSTHWLHEMPVQEEEDAEQLPEDSAPFPDKAPCGEQELSDEQLDMQGSAKQAAAEALEDGNLDTALEKYTEAIKIGNPTAMLYAKRAGVLLLLKRPCACIEDCNAAIAINPDSAKAFRLRGKAHRLLGHWEDAHKDLSFAQKVDYDDDVVDMQKFVSERWKKICERKTRRRVKEEELVSKA